MKPLTAAVVATAVALSIGVAGAQNGREIKQNGRTSGRTGGSSAATGKPDGPTRSSRTAPSCVAIGASFARTFATAATTGAT